MCCAVMRSEMSAGDAIPHEPPKKQGSSLTATALLMGTIMPKAPICQGMVCWASSGFAPAGESRPAMTHDGG